MDVTKTLARANGRLKAAQVGVKIEPKRNRLTLRATLPPKPDSERTEPYQQRIYPGYPLNPNGISRAEKEARKIGALLATKEFTWEDYQKPVSSKVTTAIASIERFREHYLSMGGSQDTWEGDYWKVLKKIPPDEAITSAGLEAVIKGTKANTKTRQRCCMAVGALAKFLDIEIDVVQYRGTYTPGSIDPRSIPSDESIVRCYSQIENPAWRWVYGMMATYGLRNHEVFHTDLADLPIIRIAEDTKTGSREVWPCYPEWVEHFTLAMVHIPNIDLSRTNQKIGHSVTSHLSPKLPFKPYDLRHAWAIRTSLFGWPVELASRQMGHSVEIHTKTYHRWINREHQQKVYDVLVKRPDRPVAPSISGIELHANGTSSDTH